MIVGVPCEIKMDEYRVAMLPSGVEELVANGHQVVVEKGAGQGSGIPDIQYEQTGAEIVAGPSEVFGRAEMVVKVKEPLPAEWPLLRDGQILFTYFHFAADEQCRRRGDETVEVRLVVDPRLLGVVAHASPPKTSMFENLHAGEA